MDIFSIAAGGVGVGVIYFVYLAASKGLPAALAWVRAKWNAGKTDIAGLQADVAGAKSQVTALEQGAIAELRSGLEAVQADVALLKKGVPAAAAPAFLSPSVIPAQATA